MVENAGKEASAPGTFETCRRTLKRSAYGGRPEVIAHSQNDAIDPTRTCVTLAMALKGRDGPVSPFEQDGPRPVWRGLP
jgi:hypothetical protein